MIKITGEKAQEKTIIVWLIIEWGFYWFLVRLVLTLAGLVHGVLFKRDKNVRRWPFHNVIRLVLWCYTRRSRFLSWTSHSCYHWHFTRSLTFTTPFFFISFMSYFLHCWFCSPCFFFFFLLHMFISILSSVCRSLSLWNSRLLMITMFMPYYIYM